MDERVAAFISKGPELSIRAKEILISEVLRVRNNPIIKPAMLDAACQHGAHGIAMLRGSWAR